MSSVEASRTGRLAGESGNRERILDAALDEFALEGFRATTLRRIAARAGVDVALLSHYFGNKDGLFAATLQLPDSARGLAVRALSGPPHTHGELLTRSYLALWEDPATSAQMQAIARSALSNEVAAEHIRLLLEGTTGDPELSALLTGRRQGFALAMTQLLGIAVGRHLTRVPVLASLDFETLVARTAPGVQAQLDASDDL